MEVGHFHPEVERWVALRTSARWEKKLAADLARCGVAVYLPLMQSAGGGDRRRFEVPLFAGYVFCSESDFIGSPRVPPGCRKQVAQVLRPSDPARLRDELGSIAEFLKNHRLVQERLYGPPGHTVRIVAGPLRGTEAVIRGLKPEKSRLVLEVSFLGVRVEVEVAEHFVEKS